VTAHDPGFGHLTPEQIEAAKELLAGTKPVKVPAPQTGELMGLIALCIHMLHHGGPT